MRTLDDIHSSSVGYAPTMIQRVLLLPLALTACTTGPMTSPPPKADVRQVVAKPVVTNDNLQGRWTIIAVNGRQAEDLWLELGGEGLGTVTKTGNGILVGSPQPRTQADLGCNDWHPNGWVWNGDKLTLGTEMSRRTERGCDPDRMALEEQAYAVLSQTMTIEVTNSGRLRLITRTAPSTSFATEAEA